MTNKEKFKEVFGYEPEDSGLPCPNECPEEFEDVDFCKGCPYRDFANAEYKKPEKKSSFHYAQAEILEDLHSLLVNHSPLPEYELISMICVFMDVVTNDYSDIDFDLGSTRHDLAEKIYNEWPHPVEYYKERKSDKKNDRID